MIEGLKRQAGNLASKQALVLGAVFTTIFGYLIANSHYQFVGIDQKIGRSIFDTAVIAFAGCAISINRSRISRREVYSFGARCAGILAATLALLCFIFTDQS